MGKRLNSLDQRLFFPATLRNRDCIANVLLKHLPKSGSVLEIGSGSGEHAVIFQKRFPYINWQTSDPELVHRESITGWIDHHGLTLKMSQPIDLDVEISPWQLPPQLISTLKAVVCINMLHIAPWSCTQALFEGVANILKTEQLLIIYGPFMRSGVHTSESNVSFDNLLKSQNESWGIRDLDQINKVAIENGLKEHDVIQMPANNLTLIFQVS